MMIEKIIKSLKESDPYIETIFMQGSCYKFHLFLKVLYPECTAFINKDCDHVISELNGRFFDITGKISGAGFRPLTPGALKLVEEWSFSNQRMLSLGECKYCEEPILI